MTKLNPDAIPHLARALIFRSIMGTHPPGAALRKLRNSVIISPVEKLMMDAGKDEANRLMSISQDDMPASPNDLSLLIDTIAMRYGMTSRAEAWRKIGINPNRGRAFFGRNAAAIDWPIWFAARAYALG